MDDFSKLQKRHEELLESQQAGVDLSQDIKDFIARVQESSSNISKSAERDQLRSNLRYWASYLYEKTGNFPRVELQPLSQQAIAKRKRTTWLPAGISVLGLLLILILAFSVPRIFPASPKPTETLTDVAAITTRPVTATGTTVASEVITATPSVEAIGLLASITYPQDDQVIFPNTIIRGKYSNLQSGWSIHVFSQPLSKGGLTFPLPDYFLVNNQSSGEWSVEGSFGNNDELTQQETYILKVGVALSDTGRSELEKYYESGFKEPPQDIILFTNKVTVDRPAYTVLDGERVVFSGYLEEENNFELFSIKLDGTDLQRITYSNTMNELYPSISPDGTQIAFVGRSRDENQNVYYQLIILNSDGSPPNVLLEEEGMLYRYPQWSPDGKLIAYAGGLPNPETGIAFWELYLYDVESMESTRVVDSRYSIEFFDWSPSGDLIYTDRAKRTATYGFFIHDWQDPDGAIEFFDSDQEDEMPAISPDGNNVVYLVGLQAYLGDVKTGQSKKISGGNYVNSAPAWSLDGSMIIFSRRIDNENSIWVYSLVDNSMSQITDFGLYPYVGQIHFELLAR